VCFPPEVLVAVSVFASALRMNIKLTLNHVQENCLAQLNKHKQDTEEEFPYKDLIGVDLLEIIQVSEYLYEYDKMVKSFIN
jgi:hypothetical protein